MRALAQGALAIVALVVGALILAAPSAHAGPDPQQSSTDVWIVDAPLVESVYPEGLVFRLRAESSAGSASGTAMRK